MAERLRVLTISDLFPSPPRPVFGVFVERLVHHLRNDCEQTVVVPYRVFPPAAIFRSLLRPGEAVRMFRVWTDEISHTPQLTNWEGIEVVYPRYSSPPRPVFHGTWGFFAYAALRARLKDLHRRNGFELIHAHVASPSGVVALLTARWMRVPVVVSVHGADVTYTARQRLFGSGVVRWVFEHADAIIANSSWTARRIMHFGGQPAKTRIIYPGAELDAGGKRTVHDERASTRATVSLLSIGNLFPNKGHATVLAAMHKLVGMGYRLEYSIVGEGPERTRLEAMAAKPPLSGRVHFVGSVPHRQVTDFYTACDIFVLASRVEGFGIVFIEALAAGKPVVGCRGTGGPEDLKALGDCIELVEPDNVDELVDVLKRLADDPVRRRQMGVIGRTIVAERFTWDRAARRTMELYGRLAANRSLPAA